MKQMQKQTKSLEVFQQRKMDYENLFSSDVGKRVLEDIKVNGYMNKTSFSQGSPYVTSYNEGQRNLALHIDYMATPLPEAKTENKKAITGE